MSVPILIIFITYDFYKGPSLDINSSNNFQSGISIPFSYFGNSNSSDISLLTKEGKSFIGLSLIGSGKNSIAVKLLNLKFNYILI
jgi:hypothetical protein